MSEDTCAWCGRATHVPCMNTRDMTDRAIEGEDACYAALTHAGGGEAGMRYVDANRARKAPCWPGREEGR